MNNPYFTQNPRPAPARAGRGTASAADVIRFPGAPAKTSRHQPGLSSADIALALEEKRMVIHYQPQYQLGSGLVIGAEALVRILDPAGELILPDRFIDEAETGEVNVAFGHAVIQAVLADLADCRSRAIAMPCVAINLSGSQLEADGGLARFVKQKLNRFGLHHGDVEFELTERQKLTHRGV